MPASLALSRKEKACSIAIVGGGASGALMTAHLLKCAGGDVRLTLIEPRPQIGRGLAYGTENEIHRLNVRASNMSAFADDPDHFWRWLRANGRRGEDRFCFVPRLVYGRYLGGLIEDRVAKTDPPRVRWLRETVTDLREGYGAVTLHFAGGRAAEFDMAVLCCEGSWNTHALGGTSTAWRLRSKPRSERCRRAAGCEFCRATCLRSVRNQTKQLEHRTVI